MHATGGSSGGRLCLGACAVTFLALFCGSVSALRFMGGTGNEPGATGWVLRMYRAWGEGRYLCERCVTTRWLAELGISVPTSPHTPSACIPQSLALTNNEMVGYTLWLSPNPWPPSGHTNPITSRVITKCHRRRVRFGRLLPACPASPLGPQRARGSSGGGWGPGESPLSLSLFLLYGI